MVNSDRGTGNRGRFKTKTPIFETLIDKYQQVRVARPQIIQIKEDVTLDKMYCTMQHLITLDIMTSV
jgi:hypothetical protein